MRRNHLAADEHRSTQMKPIALSVSIGFNLCGLFAGETACATTSGGGAGIQPAEDIHPPVARTVERRRPTRWR